MKDMARGYFVTGTDTGVGKTYVSCLLVRALVGAGLKVAVMKPVAAGLEPDGSNEDVRLLSVASNVLADRADVNPYAFAPPVAPHIAAELAGVSVQLDRIQRAYANLQRQSDVVVVEGAGGLLVPLNSELDMSAIPLQLDLPVVLVVGMRLGCLNHALLTVEAIRQRGLKLAGWIANEIDPEMAENERNMKTLMSCISGPFLGKVGWQSGATLNMARELVY